MISDAHGALNHGGAGGAPHADVDTAPGIYVHIPFCRRKCRYCDFFSISGTEGIPRFLDALDREIHMADRPAAQPDSLYIGGGTPSLLDPLQMERIIDKVRRRFHLADHAEISIEANPGTLSLEKLRAYAALGCNRLNIGIQSFDDGHLAFLGRIHDTRQALDAVDQARTAGFRNLGIDLIYGLPGQTATMWRSDLEKALALQPEHLSCYLLSIEPRTALHADLRAGRFSPLSEQRCADLFRWTHHHLDAAGYAHYEISNFSRTPALRSRHNQKYWRFNSYTGLGPSAHSYDPTSQTRSWNHADLERYLASLQKGRLPVADGEHLDREQQMMEAVYCGLRMSDGIDTSAFGERFDTDFGACFAPVLDSLAERDWIVVEDGKCRPTLDGMLFLDRMVAELIDVIEPD